MKRGEFLRSAGVVSAGLALPGAMCLLADEPADRWRTFEVTTRVEILKAAGTTRIWLPAQVIDLAR